MILCLFVIVLQQLAAMDSQAVSSAVQLNFIPQFHLVHSVPSVLPGKEKEKGKFDELGGRVVRCPFPIQLLGNC